MSRRQVKFLLKLRSIVWGIFKISLAIGVHCTLLVIEALFLNWENSGKFPDLSNHPAAGPIAIICFAFGIVLLLLAYLIRKAIDKAFK